MKMEKIKSNDLLKDIEIQHEFTTEDLKDFFKSISVLSVPVLKGEAFGLYQIEALASGVPLVQPDLGAFPEIIRASNGGAIYSPNTAEALAHKLKEVLSGPERLLEMSIAGREAVEEKFKCSKLTQNMIDIYHQITK